MAPGSPRHCLALALLLAAACSDSVPIGYRMQRCLDACEAGRSCPETESAFDCYVLCDDLDAVNHATDCWDSYDDLYDCMDVHGVCETDERCASQQEAYGDCIAENCSTDPDRDECAL